MAPNLPPELSESLSRDFFIRFTTMGRKSGLPRTTETTFVWTGGTRIYISGYPGTRDWIANMAANPRVVVHTVERGVYYDIPGTARIVHDRDERTPNLFAFLDRWAKRPEAPRRMFQCVIQAMRINHRAGLPWWGPFWIARRVLDRMPCAEITFIGPPQQRSTPPPAAAQPQ